MSPRHLPGGGPKLDRRTGGRVGASGVPGGQDRRAGLARLPLVHPAGAKSSRASPALH